MTKHTTRARPLAIVVGALATLGALAILLAEPIQTGNWRLDHFMLPLVVAITIAAGHLVGAAVRGLRPLATAGFLMAFLIGTALTVYSSVGNQREKMGARASTAEAHNLAVSDKRAELAKSRRSLALSEDMLKSAQARLPAACHGGNGKDCKGVTATIAVYQSAIKGDRATVGEVEADLARLGGTHVARPKAEALGELAAVVFGVDGNKVALIASTLEPFSYSLLFEITAIVAFGYGFGHSRRQPIVAVPVSTENEETEPLAIENRPHDKAEALADLLTLLGTGKTIPSQDYLAERWQRSKACVSKWVSEWETRELVTRQQIGKCKQTEAA